MPIDPNTHVGQLGVGARCVAKLEKLNIHTVAEVAATDYSVLLDAVGFAVSKELLKAIRSAGLQPTIESPIWEEAQWREFVEGLIGAEIVSWKDVALAVCGELNPPQVGTAIASNKSFQEKYGKGKTMQAVMAWFYRQDGRCAVCGTRLFLEADHIKSKQAFREEGNSETDADTLDNLQLLCKRCNVVKRPSHDLGGLSFAPAQAVLIWILLSLKPKSKLEFYRICRAHGLTMANIRFDEAWAFAVWLARAGKYRIEQG